MKALFLAAAVFAAGAVRAAEAPKGMQMLSLGCVEALASVGMADLAGVFSFISEKDGPAAFADLLVRNPKAMTKFLGKVGKDREIGGVSAWLHQVLVFALSIYGSPLSETLDTPSPKTVSKLNDYAGAPTLSLEDLTARRRR